MKLPYLALKPWVLCRRVLTSFKLRFSETYSLSTVTLTASHSSRVGPVRWGGPREPATTGACGGRSGTLCISWAHRCKNVIDRQGEKSRDKVYRRLNVQPRRLWFCLIVKNDLSRSPGMSATLMRRTSRANQLLSRLRFFDFPPLWAAF